MAWKYNIFTGQLDYYETSSGGTGDLVSYNYMGSNCSGAEGSGRTLTVASGDATVRIVSVDREILRPTTDYTLSGNIITFNVDIYDVNSITVWML